MNMHPQERIKTVYLPLCRFVTVEAILSKFNISQLRACNTASSFYFRCVTVPGIYCCTGESRISYFSCFISTGTSCLLCGSCWLNCCGRWRVCSCCWLVCSGCWLVCGSCGLVCGSCVLVCGCCCLSCCGCWLVCGGC